VHLVGFIIKKFVTMHSQMKVKFEDLCPCRIVEDALGIA
jgi:hypothetical protein